MSDDDRAVMERLAALEAEVKADAAAKQARKEAALAKVRERRAKEQAAKDELRQRQAALGTRKPAAKKPVIDIGDDDDAGGKDEIGGALELARKAHGVKGELTKAGSNWVWDGFVQKSTYSGSFMADPYTGLYWPLRAEGAEVTVQAGLPVGTNTDWVVLNTADTIEVPADAWLDWDAAAQTFIPAGEGVTAKVKVVMTYPADIYDTKWHDGSNLSAGDFVMRMIMNFDQAKAESAIFDEDVVPNYEAGKATFTGVKIVSTDPLVIETYTDNFYADAELIAVFGDWWPLKKEKSDLLIIPTNTPSAMTGKW